MVDSCVSLFPATVRIVEMRRTPTIGVPLLRTASLCFGTIFSLSAIFTATVHAQCPNMPPPRIEQVDFTSNEKVIIDHQAAVTHNEIEKLVNEGKEPKKPMAIGEFGKKNEIEWESPPIPEVGKVWPLAYVQGTTIKIAKTRLALEAAAQNLIEKNLEGEITLIGQTTVGAMAIEFKQKVTQAEAITQVKAHPKYLEMPAEATTSAALPKEVIYSKMGIKWKWKLKEKGAAEFEQAAGESIHDLYLTYATAASPIYFTLLAQDTEMINKKSGSAAEVIAGMWKGFSNGAGAPKGMPIWIDEPATDGISKGTENMWYYQEMPLETLEKVRELEAKAIANELTLGTTVQLLEYLDGECGAWREAFDNALEAEGIKGSIDVKIVPTTGEKMLVKSWKLPKAGAGFPNKEAEVKKEAGMAGQGVATPSSFFSVHVAVEVEKKLYDPSYGIGPIEGANGSMGEGPLGAGAEAKKIQEEFQKKSIAGFCQKVAAEYNCQQATNALELGFSKL
jgi:hypothetical protein